MSLQQHEIGLETCPPRRPRNPVALVPENCNIEFDFWKPDTYSFRVGDQVECTMENSVLEYRMTEIEEEIDKRNKVTRYPVTR
jgi:hypothetical protein